MTPSKVNNRTFIFNGVFQSTIVSRLDPDRISSNPEPDLPGESIGPGLGII